MELPLNKSQSIPTDLASLALASQDPSDGLQTNTIGL
jgi:hypothetical protein